MTTYESRFWTKSYDDHVKTDLDYPKENLGKLFDDSMKRFPDRPAIWMMEREITFKEFRDLVHRFGTFLQENGIKKGDVVAINLPNSPQYMIAHFGALLVGAVASGCSPLLSGDELAYQINDSKAKVLITLDKVYAKVLKAKGILSKVPNLEIVVVTNISEYMGLSSIKVFLGKLLGKIPKGKVTPYEGKMIIKFLDIMKQTEPNVKEVKINPEKDLALMQYTGGTTGRPKGTQLTHANQIANMIQISNWINLEPGKDISLSAFPLFHLAGLCFCQISVYLSNPQILIPDPRDTNHFLHELVDKRPTLIANVPSLYLMIMKNPKSNNVPKDVLDNVIVYISGAAPFPAEAIKDFQNHMDADNKVLEVYGMTETSPILTMNPFKGEKKIGTVGLPVQDTDVRFVDIETGEDVPIGKAGEILCKGPQITPGYYNKPEANKKTFIDGWLRTGDVGVMDENGYITIVDRTKDMLIVSGYKVYSVHVEDILVKHPDIELVAIIGIKNPDRPGSEIVKAVVQLKSGVNLTEEVKEDIKKYAEENLSKYEKPKIWEFREELPLTTVGKVLKRKLREEDTAIK
ncbi:MAG: AMP-binding protein [Candidatus Helarchaeota archaeon]